MDTPGARASRARCRCLPARPPVQAASRSRSLIDFARLMELFERKKISFVSVTQQFNTTQSMGRLTLNILLSFAQFEREIISERTRDKIAATRRKGKWSGGRPILGFDVDPRGGRLSGAVAGQRLTSCISADSGARHGACVQQRAA